MTPGTLAMMLFVDQIVAAMKRPGPATVLIALLLVALIGLGMWGQRRWLRHTEKNREEA